MKLKQDNEDNAFYRARRSLLLDHTFFGSLVMHLRDVADEEAKHGIWVDGTSVGYNPKALEALELGEAAGLLAKGVMQCALGHHARRGDRDVKMWNQASDFVVNPEVVDSGLRLPKDALLDRSYQGKSVEQAYAMLEAVQQKQQQQQKQQDGDKQQDGGKDGKGEGSSKQPAQQPGQGKPQKGDAQAAGKGSGSTQGEVRDMPADEQGEVAGEAQKAGSEREWKIAMQQALQNAQSRGDMPGNLKAMIETALKPGVDWRAEVRRFMHALSRDELTWARPNRRFIGSGLYLPSTRGNRMGKMVIFNDTSGSTSSAQAAFLAEMRAIGEDVNPEALVYIQGDTRITDVIELEPGDELPAGIKGMGGTDFRPVFDYCEQNDIEPACMIFLTDLDGPFPTEEPAYPVLWVNVGGEHMAARVPFGEVINIDRTGV